MAQQESSNEESLLLRNLERTADVVRLHPHASLGWLAGATGGFFVRDTNDIGGALRRIDSDLRTYYLLGYTPTNEVFDGRFRRIEVKVKRRGVSVRARGGYFAVRTEGAVLAHVAPALALLERGQRPRAFDLFAGALPFAAVERPARVSLVLDAPWEALVRLARKEKEALLDLTLLARIRNEDGRPVEAVSGRFELPLRNGKAGEGDCRLLRDVWLAPGHYTLESAAYEAGSGRASVIESPFEVPDGRDPMDRVQAVLVHDVVRAEGASGNLERGHPLRYGNVVIRPLVGEPLLAGGRPVIFQLTAPAGTAPPRGEVEVWHGHDRIGSSPVAWTGPGEDGLWRQVAEIPAARLEAGGYELRVRLADEGRERALRLPFTLAK
jgi:hypothetical protein